MELEEDRKPYTLDTQLTGTVEAYFERQTAKISAGTTMFESTLTNLGTQLITVDGRLSKQGDRWRSAAYLVMMQQGSGECR